MTQKIFPYLKVYRFISWTQSRKNSTTSQRIYLKVGTIDIGRIFSIWRKGGCVIWWGRVRYFLLMWTLIVRMRSIRRWVGIEFWGRKWLHSTSINSKPIPSRTTLPIKLIPNRQPPSSLELVSTSKMIPSHDSSPSSTASQSFRWTANNCRIYSTCKESTWDI